MYCQGFKHENEKAARGNWFKQSQNKQEAYFDE